MKKILQGLIIIAIIYTGASFYTGYQIKNSFYNSLDSVNQDLHLQGLDVYVVSYKRGIFTSTLELNIGPAVPSFSDTDEKVGVNTKTKIYHGPLLFVHKFGLGQFSSQTKLIPKTKHSDFNKEYQKLLGDSFGKLYISNTFLNTYHLDWKMDPVDFSEKGQKVAIGDSFLTMQVDLKTKRIQGDFQWGKMQWDINQTEHLEITSAPLTSHFDFTNIDNAFSVGSLNLALDKLTVKKNGIPIEIEKALITTESKIVGSGIDASVKFSVDAIQGPVAVNKLYYQIDVLQISTKALKHVAEIQRKLVAESPTKDSQQLALISYTQTLQEFLQPGLGLKLAIGANYKNEDIQFNFDSRYHPLGNGMTFELLKTPQDYLLLVDVDIKAKIPKSLDANGLLTEYIGTRVTETEKDYLIEAHLKNGEMTVGTEIVQMGEFITQFFSAYSKLKN